MCHNEAGRTALGFGVWQAAKRGMGSALLQDYAHRKKDVALMQGHRGRLSPTALAHAQVAATPQVCARCF